MDSSSALCWMCASFLLFGVMGVQSLAVPLIKWRLLSQSTGRFVVLRPTGEVDADGPDMGESDIECAPAEAYT